MSGCKMSEYINDNGWCLLCQMTQDHREGCPVARIKELDDQVEALQAKVHLCAGYDQLEAENERLRKGWLEAIEAIDHQEVKTAEACERYPQDERDTDRAALKQEGLE